MEPVLENGVLRWWVGLEKHGLINGRYIPLTVTVCLDATRLFVSIIFRGGHICLNTTP